jgi:nucleoside-diphosphate-sugar epimerase
MIITGAGGLLGRHLAEELHQEGHQVTGIGRSPRPPPDLACDRWISADLADSHLRGHDWTAYRGAPVFHLAGEIRIYESGRDFHRDNVATTETACAIAQRTGGRLVFFSSAAVYSGPRTHRPVTALRETDETVPDGDYGRTKLAAEDLIRRTGVDAVVLRLFGVLSHRLAGLPDRGNLVQAIVRAWQTGTEVAISTDALGEPPVRDYVLARDVCRCAHAALTWTHSSASPLTVNICTGEATTTAQMVRLAAEAAGRTIPCRLTTPARAVNPVMLGDPSLLRKLTGGVPANQVGEFWVRLLQDLAQVPASF